MTARKWAELVSTNVRRTRRTFLLSSFGIAVGIASLAFFAALSAGVRSVVLGKVFPVDRIEVEQAKSGLELPLGGLLGGGPAPITDDTVTRLRAISGVRSATGRMRLGFPAKAWGGAQFLGKNLITEMLGDGLDPAALGVAQIGPLPFADLERPDGKYCEKDDECAAPEYCEFDVHQCQRPVPAVASRFLVELYNTTIAGSHGLPKISDFLVSRFKGVTFTMELGSSFVGPRAARGVPRQRRIMLVGVSDRAVRIGLSFPLAYVKRWNAEYAGEASGRSYTSVMVEVTDKSAITRVAAEARNMGLSLVDNGAEQAGLAITLVTLLFALVSLAILVVAAINIAHTFFRAVVERRREIGVMRAVGASERDIRWLLLGEAGAVGVCGGLAGLGAAWLASLAIDLASRRFVPDFPFKPQSYFHFSPALCLGVLGFAVVTCLAGALWPARTAARLQPAEALSAP